MTLVTTSTEQLSLYDYQQEGVEWLTSVRRGILADEMGLGKTVQAIAAMQRLFSAKRRALVVCSSLLVQNWVHELSVWAPGVNALQLDWTAGTIGERQEQMLAMRDGVAVTNYEAFLAMKQAQRSKWDLVIYDEAHKLKNRKTQTFTGAKTVARYTDALFLLTGTPIMNEPADLWPLLHAIDPKHYSSYWRFVQTYAYVFRNQWGGWVVEGLKESGALRAELRGLLLRREKADVLSLPDKVVKTVRLTLDEPQRREYNRMSTEMVARLMDGRDMHATVTLAQLTRLRQIAVDLSLLEEKPAPLRGPKARFILELAQTRPGPIVVFSQFATALQRLKYGIREADKTISVGCVTGGSGDRDETLGAFHRGEIDVLCMTTSLAEGLTLTESNVAVFLDRMWTPARNDQAADRLHRIGQTNKVTIVNLLSTGTIEESIEQALLRKEKTIAQVLGRDELVAALGGT